MYSDAFDSVKVIDLESGTAVSTEGWNSIALELKQKGSGMVTDDLVIEVGNTKDDPKFLKLSNQSVKAIRNIDTNDIKHYAVEDGLTLSEDEKKANAVIKRTILNLMGFDGDKLVRPARTFIKVTGDFASMRLILAKPEAKPQL